MWPKRPDRPRRPLGLARRCYSQERILQGLFLTTCPLAIAGSRSQPCNLICYVRGTSSQYNLVSPHPVFLSELQSAGQPSGHFAQLSNVLKSLRKTCLVTLQRASEILPVGASCSWLRGCLRASLSPRSRYSRDCH